MSAFLDNQTKAFIDENPIQVTVIRRKRVSVAGGGWKWQEQSTLPTQRCRRVFRGNVGDRNQRTLSDGRIVTVLSTLVFQLDGDVQEGDLVILPEGEQWEVSRVTNRYAIDAEVFQHAS